MTCLHAHLLAFRPIHTFSLLSIHLACLPGELASPPAQMAMPNEALRRGTAQALSELLRGGVSEALVGDALHAPHAMGAKGAAGSSSSSSAAAAATAPAVLASVVSGVAGCLSVGWVVRAGWCHTVSSRWGVGREGAHCALRCL
jgi:hypothetical protein